MGKAGDILNLIKTGVFGRRRTFSAWQIELTTRCPLMCGMCISGCDESLAPFYNILSEAKAKAEELKINLRAPLLSPGEVTVCGENPLRNLYISVEGEVSPCVYLYPPSPSPFKRIFCGSECTIKKVSFGNIFTGSFNSIWNSGGYKEFRDGFVRRQKRLPEALLPDPPGQCMTCHKILGL
jgi:MoaA/NifB/PqqE/SkfB family radical SAM enzyme